MSGVSVVKALLHAATALTAVVPTARIMAGVLPLKTERPAISITEISAIERLTVTMGETKKMITERVQVTVEALTYPTQKSILLLVRAALPLSRGTVNSIEVDSILPGIVGPDIFDPDIAAYVQSQDFIVKFSR